MAEACAEPRRGRCRRSSRLVDRRQLLHLDRPRRRPARLEPAGRGARRARRRRPASIRRRWREAREEMLIAEGSDWFWWYGDDHSSAHDLEFDDLFRRHLRNVYRLLQRPIPDELFVSNISTGRAASAQTEPTGAAHADARRRGDELLRVARRRQRWRSATSPARCTRPSGQPGAA